MAGNVGMTIGNVIITSTCVLPLISLFFFFLSFSRFCSARFWFSDTVQYQVVRFRGNDFHGYGWWIRSKLQGWLDIQVLWLWLCSSQLWSFSSLEVFKNKVASSKAKPHCFIYIHKNTKSNYISQWKLLQNRKRWYFYTFWPKKAPTSVGAKLCIYAQLLQ